MRNSDKWDSKFNFKVALIAASRTLDTARSHAAKLISIDSPLFQALYLPILSAVAIGVASVKNAQSAQQLRALLNQGIEILTAASTQLDARFPEKKPKPPKKLAATKR